MRIVEAKGRKSDKITRFERWRATGSQHRGTCKEEADRTSRTESKADVPDRLEGHAHARRDLDWPLSRRARAYDADAARYARVTTSGHRQRGPRGVRLEDARWRERVQLRQAERAAGDGALCPRRAPLDVHTRRLAEEPAPPRQCAGHRFSLNAKSANSTLLDFGCTADAEDESRILGFVQ
eukprot:6184036-Pleurochrysis_carterae.AAC.2